LENWPSFNICILLQPTCMVRYFYPHINCFIFLIDEIVCHWKLTHINWRDQGFEPRPWHPTLTISVFLAVELARIHGQLFIYYFDLNVILVAYF
jgi:hypothetical protein